MQLFQNRKQSIRHECRIMGIIFAYVRDIRQKNIRYTRHPSSAVSDRWNSVCILGPIIIRNSGLGRMREDTKEENQVSYMRFLQTFYVYIILTGQVLSIMLFRMFRNRKLYKPLPFIPCQVVKHLIHSSMNTHDHYLI